MLSEISQSSKRLGKLKKYKSKVKQSGFDFLLQSLERDKENHAPNHLTANRHGLAHSVQIDPLLTAPVHSFTLNNYPNDGRNAFYLDNVKLLDRSDLTLSENNHSIPSKKSRKREHSSRSRKEGKRQNSGKSRGSEAEYDEIIYKTKQYLSITDDILSEIDISRWKFGKKAKGISKELVSLITALQSKRQGKGMNHSTLMNQSVKTTSFNMYASEMPSGVSQPFVKRINGLQVERQKLNSLISQHEMANIKMYIKLNEGESEEIQLCKKQLALLFDKYKILQGLVSKDKKKMAEMAAENKEKEKKCQQLIEQNSQLMEMIQKLQETLEKQQKFRKEKETIGPIRVSMLRPQSHLRQHSYPSFLQNSEAQRGQLRIQSLQNSCNESRFQSDQIMPLSSSITTSTSRINKKGGKLGINLNALLQNLTQNQVQRIADDPQRLRIMMKECRQTIMRMQGIITQQNRQLQLSIRAIKDLQLKLNIKQESISQLEERIQQQLTRRKKESRTALINQSESKGKKGRKEDRRVEVDQKGKVFLDVNFKKAKYDEYRIIAMQALALEQAIANQRIK